MIAILLREAPEHVGHAGARARALGGHRRAAKHPHAALVEEAVDQLLGRDRGIDQLDILDSLEQGTTLDPCIIFGHLMGWRAGGRIARVEIGLARAFGRTGQETDQIGFIDSERAVFGRSYAAEPDVLIEQLRKDEAIAEADTLLLTVPNQLGVAYNVHVIEAILTTVAPGLSWR